jgi:hypothetical protein
MTILIAHQAQQHPYVYATPEQRLSIQAHILLRHAELYKELSPEQKDLVSALTQSTIDTACPYKQPSSEH